MAAGNTEVWWRLGAVALIPLGVAAALVWRTGVPGPADGPVAGRHARLRHAFVVPGPERDLLALVVTGWEGQGELVSFDLDTGARLTTVPLCKDPQVYQPVGARLWVSCGETELFAVHMATGALGPTAASLQAAHPELAAGLRVEDRTVSLDVDGPTNAIGLRLHDGRLAWVDLDGALHLTHPGGEPWVPGYFCWPEHTCLKSRRACLGFTPAPSGAGMVLAQGVPWGERQTPATAVGDWPTGLLRPGFVREPDNRCALESEDAYLFLHDSAAFDPKETLLSLVSHDGDLRWTRTIASFGVPEGVEVRKAKRLDEDRAVLLFFQDQARDHLSVAVIDLRSGATSRAHTLLAGR